MAKGENKLDSSYDHAPWWTICAVATIIVMCLAYLGGYYSAVAQGGW